MIGGQGIREGGRLVPVFGQSAAALLGAIPLAENQCKTLGSEQMGGGGIGRVSGAIDLLRRTVGPLKQYNVKIW